MQVHRRKKYKPTYRLERQTKIDTESTPIHKMVLYHRVHNRRDSNFVAVATAQETKTASRKLASKAIALREKFRCIKFMDAELTVINFRLYMITLHDCISIHRFYRLPYIPSATALPRAF